MRTFLAEAWCTNDNHVFPTWLRARKFRWVCPRGVAWRGTGLALAYACSSMRPVRLAISWYTIRGKVDDSTCGHHW